ncbi:hypothetical protein RI129_012475 [Pyrocoelia pectoralis]|uniref:Uncharacterized protein n=1 Tax=Pyrocoelia pectoralis TaxID=417401 RepID=A0AAN7Z5Z1_9COLE
MIAVYLFVPLLGSSPLLPLHKFQLCKRSDPNINGCLKSAIQNGLSVLKDGSIRLGYFRFFLISNITRESYWLTASFSEVDFTAISSYSIHGQILFFHLDSEGKAEVNFTSMEGNVVNNRFRLHKIAVKIHPKGITFDLENIIQGQKKLSDDVNKVINDSWDVLFSEFELELDAIIGAIWLEYANNVLTYVPVLLDI